MPYFEIDKLTACPDIILVEAPPHIDSYFEIGEHYYYKDNFIIDTISRIGLKKKNTTYVVYASDSSILGNLDYIIWLKLLEKGFTFVHAAALQFKNKGVLPAWGGIGKTSISVSLLLNNQFSKDWRHLSEDFVIISENKLMYCYPTNFAVYSYHIPLFQEYFYKHPIHKLSLQAYESLKVDALPYIVQRLLAHIPLIPIKESLYIPVEKVIPKDKFAEKAFLHRIYFLTKEKSAHSIKIMEYEANEVSQSIISILLYYMLTESPYFLRLIIATSSFGLLNFEKYLRMLRTIIDRVSSNVKCYKIKLPLHYDSYLVAKEIHRHMESW
ncbi:MAG: hypothetical protein B6U94_05405 [Thermofilum sp. ex4484_79]|nr:MAG: hypothetical protein B6U94_05405 [Thermofilum sp. ex4484_79]